MRDETKNTEVEVWMAEVFRYEDPDGELVEIAPPYRTIRSELHLGGEVTIGRSIGDPSRQGAGRIEISDSDQISRIALTLTEGSFATTAYIGQLDGAHVQQWGSIGSWLNSQGAKFDINHRPVSFRIETRDFYYWILVNPCVRIIPPQYLPQTPDDGVTDGTRKPIPEGDPVRQKLSNTLADLEIYYHQFLEWPPRIVPVTGNPAGEVSSRKRLIALGASLNKYGFPRYKSNGRDPAIIEWLIESGLIDVEDLRQERRETIKPESKI